MHKSIFFWQLIDYVNTDEYGDLSAKIFIQGDCNKFIFRWKQLSYHKQAMARDNVIADKPSSSVSGWQYPKYGTTSYKVLEHVCKNKGLLL